MIEFDRPWRNMEEDNNEEYGGCSADFESLIGITHPFDIDPLNLDKRTSAMVCILDNPKANKKYVRNMAINLINKCGRADRTDLINKIQEALIVDPRSPHSLGWG